MNQDGDGEFCLRLKSGIAINFTYSIAGGKVCVPRVCLLKQRSCLVTALSLIVCVCVNFVMFLVIALSLLVIYLVVIIPSRNNI